MHRHVPRWCLWEPCLHWLYWIPDLVVKSVRNRFVLFPGYVYYLESWAKCLVRLATYCNSGSLLLMLWNRISTPTKLQKYLPGKLIRRGKDGVSSLTVYDTGWRLLACVWPSKLVKLGVWHIWRSHQCGLTHVCHLWRGTSNISEMTKIDLHGTSCPRVCCCVEIRIGMSRLLINQCLFKLTKTLTLLTSIAVFRHLTFNTVFVSDCRSRQSSAWSFSKGTWPYNPS